jgi:hypothetical protein
MGVLSERQLKEILSLLVCTLDATNSSNRIAGSLRRNLKQKQHISCCRQTNHFRTNLLFNVLPSGNRILEFRTSSPSAGSLPTLYDTSACLTPDGTLAPLLAPRTVLCGTAVGGGVDERALTGLTTLCVATGASTGGCVGAGDGVLLLLTSILLNKSDSSKRTSTSVSRSMPCESGSNLLTLKSNGFPRYQTRNYINIDI